MNRRMFVAGGLTTAGFALVGCAGDGEPGASRYGGTLESGPPTTPESGSVPPDITHSTASTSAPPTTGEVEGAPQETPNTIPDGLVALAPLEGLAAPYMGVSDNYGLVTMAAENPAALPDYIARAKKFGNVLRIDFDSPDGSLEEVHDRIMAEARRQAMGVIGIGGAYLTDPEVAGSYAAHVADRYGPQNDGPLYWVEADNEPNHRLQAAEYIRLLLATARGVKGVNPDIQVVTGGLAPGDDAQHPIRYFEAILKGLGPEGLKVIDGFGMHPYDSPSRTHTEPWSTWARVEAAFPHLMKQYGVNGWPLYLTENGAPTSGDADRVVTPDHQREIIQWVAEHPMPHLTTAMRLIYVSQAIHFAANDPEGHYGIEGKPAGGWLEERIAQAREAA